MKVNCYLVRNFNSLNSKWNLRRIIKYPKKISFKLYMYKINFGATLMLGLNQVRLKTKIKNQIKRKTRWMEYD